MKILSYMTWSIVKYEQNLSADIIIELNEILLKNHPRHPCIFIIEVDELEIFS